MSQKKHKYNVTYRAEFQCEVIAENRKKAINAFRKKMNKYIVCDLWEEFFRVYDNNGDEVEE